MGLGGRGAAGRGRGRGCAGQILHPGGRRSRANSDKFQQPEVVSRCLRFSSSSEWRTFLLCSRFQGVAETCKAIIDYIDSFILQAKGGERWPDVVAPTQGWDRKDERWKRATPILARSHALRRRRRQWHCEACGKHASDVAAKAKLARTERVGHLAMTLGEQARPQCHLLAQTGSFVWCCRCGAIAAKFAKKLGEPCVGHPRTQECARSIRLLSGGLHPRKTAFCSRSKHGQGGGTSTKGTNVTVAEAQPTNPDDKNHRLLKSGEVKWCWRCGARVERNSAPSVCY